MGDRRNAHMTGRALPALVSPGQRAGSLAPGRRVPRRHLRLVGYTTPGDTIARTCRSCSGRGVRNGYGRLDVVPDAPACGTKLRRSTPKLIAVANERVSNANIRALHGVCAHKGRLRSIGCRHGCTCRAGGASDTAGRVPPCDPRRTARPRRHPWWPPSAPYRTRIELEDGAHGK